MSNLVERIPQRNNVFKLGRHIEHDERSRNYRFTAVARESKSVLWPISKSVLDQGNLGACVGFALANCFNTGPFRNTRNQFSISACTNLSGREFYAMATHLDEWPEEWPPDDEGSSGLGAAKAGQMAGYIERYEHTFSFEEFAQALQSQPLIVGTYWTDSMFYPGHAGVLTVDPLSSSHIAGGHEYCAIAIDYENKLCWFRNSWGKSWGVSNTSLGPAGDGNFAIRFADFTNLLAADGDSTVPIVRF